tara:strand:- start:319 stop:537 length:219 start_codon:yes stop_codon:yes gene_type:complete
LVEEFIGFDVNLIRKLELNSLFKVSSDGKISLYSKLFSTFNSFVSLQNLEFLLKEQLDTKIKNSIEYKILIT